MIASKIHAIIDYVVGVLLIVAPYLLGFANGGPEHLVPVVLGAITVAYSLITRYELSVAQIIPYRGHLGIDAALGGLLAVSPWLFGFASSIWWPHVLVGLLELAVVALSWAGAATADHI
jgi:hypothetical protein